MPAAPTRRFWHLESFSGGLDRRDGVFSQNQNRFWDLVNVQIKNTKRIGRRPPCQRNATAFVNAKGCIEWRGALYTVAKKGDAVTKPAEVTGELRFDNPDHCTTWELVQLQTFSGIPVAVIKHTFPGGTVTHQYRLHVFDGKKNKPTYVEDPWCPIGWGPTLPLHLYRTGDRGTFDPNWVPVVKECSGRLYMSRPDGNLAFCKTGNARVWNDRTVEDMQEGGEWFYFFTNATSGLQNFIVSESYANIIDPFKWAGYVLEYLDADGTWVEITEKMQGFGDPSVHAEWLPVSVASRFAGGPNELNVRVYWTAGAGSIIRFRLPLDPAVTVSGTSWEFSATQELYNGTGAQVNFPATMPVAKIRAVRVNGVLQTPGVNYNFALPNNVVFTVAPSAGTGNVQFVQGSYLVDPPSSRMTYQGQEVVFHSVAGTSSQGLVAFLTSEEHLFGVSQNLLVANSMGPSQWNITTDTLPFGTSNRGRGQHRIHTVWQRRLVSATTGTDPVPIAVELPYVYSDGEFYLERTLEYQLNLAGADDSGDLPTASQQGSDGGYVTCLSALKDRLLVSYKGGTQLWQVSGLPEEHALLGFGPVGTGDQVRPLGAVVGQSVVLGMARGLMSLNLSGSNLDSLRDINLGEPIEELGRVEQFDAAFWPVTGQYVTAVEMLDDDNAKQFLHFDHSPEQKINAWKRWTVKDLPDFETNSMVATAERLYFRAGGYLYWFDLAATDYIDVHDDPAEPYESACWLHFNHLEAPWRQKQAVELEWVMRGAVTVTIRYNPDLPDEETGEVVYTGMTAGRARVPVSVWGYGLAPVIRSRDRTGFEMEEIGMWFLVRGR